jgi:hypothetical protein
MYNTWYVHKHIIGSANLADFKESCRKLFGETRQMRTGKGGRVRGYVLTRESMRDALAAHYKCDPSEIVDLEESDADQPEAPEAGAMSLADLNQVLAEAH